MFGRRFRTAIAALLGTALVVSVTQALPAQADTTLSTPLQVNFQAQTSATPSGYQADYGQAYTATRGYGWVTTGAGTPLDLTANGRTRGVSSNPLLDSFMQMQAKQNSGTTTPGAWKAAIANGTYAVTIGVGDPSYTDSEDVVNVEGNKVIDFTPTTANTSQVTTSTVTVSDGFLNIDPLGGTNTKIDYIQVNSSSSTAPYVQSVTPANGSNNATVDTAVSIVLSNGVDPNTVNAAGMQLFDSNNNQIAGHYNVDGAYASATFQPTSTLTPNATYTFKTTSSLKDPSGNSYTPFTSTFSTGTGSTNTGTPSVAFNQSLFDYSDGSSNTTTAYSTQGPTAMALGPNPAAPTQLWVAVSSGAILVYNLDPNTGQKVGAPTVVTTFKLNRIVSGLTFDPSSTATNIKLWVSNGEYGCDLAALGVACDDFTGAVSELTGTSATGLTKTDVVTGLPRSVGNHMNNGTSFGPDGNLYLAQAAENGYGAPDAIWGNRAEDALSATVLKINQTSIISGGKAPYNVSTDTSLANPYNYKATGALVTPYVTGIRNPFTLVWDSNGKLYAPVNESSNGNSPATTTGQAALTNLPAFDDYFTQVVAGKFYGHPNPARGENYVLNGGNPTSGTDPFEVSEYPVGTQPNSNWRKPDMDLGVHRSADGTTEFKSGVFGSALQGQILVSEYSQGKDILAIKLDASGNPVSKTVVASGFYNPLPLVSDPSTGRVYVGEYGRDPDGLNGQISLLTPNTSTVVTPPTSNTSLHVDFGAASTTPVSGYTLDDGGAYNATSGFGWEDNSTSAPTSLVGNGRQRNVNSNKLQDTLVQMQASSGSGITTPGKWVATVPNGNYTVTVGVGDPSYVDSHDVLNAEGTKIVDFMPSTATPQSVVTATVTVADGQLTIDPTGGTNTKITYIDVVPVGGVTASPTVTVTPSGTRDGSGNYVGSATVTIAASETGGTIAGTTYTLDGGAAQTYTAPFQLSTVGSHTVVATATDGTGTTGTGSSTFSVVASGGTGTGTGTTLHVNFGAATTAAINGYTLDDGAAFSTTAGFGWENAGGNAPLSYVGNGRERNVNSNKLQDTFMQAQLAGSSSGNHTAGAWEAVVANGTYTVTIGVGDPSYTDSHDVVNAEGTKIVDFTPTTATPQSTVTATVTVADGRLTLDPTGGTNLKIDYIDIVPQGSTPPPPGDTTAPTVTVAVNGTTNTAGNYLDTATVAITATDNTGGSGVKSTSYTLDGGAATAYTAPFQVNTVGTHTVVATSTDNAGNTSAAVTKTFTIVSSSSGPPSPSSLKVTSPEDDLGLGSRLVFSTVKNESRTGHSATLTNSGTGTLNITGLTFGGTNAKDFQFCSTQAQNITLAPGASTSVCVQYRPSVDATTKGTQTSQGTLTIVSNDSTAPSYVITLGGLNTENYESYHEPSLQQIFDALGYSDNVGVTNLPQFNGISSTSAAVGDEILSPYFKALDTTKNVTVVPIAHYSGKDPNNSASVGWYAKGSTTMNYLYALPGGSSGANDSYGQNQLLLPTTTTGSSGINSETFKATGSFGLGENFNGPASKSDDTKNTGGFHNLRFYPAKDANGKVITGSYLVGDDVGVPITNSAKNWDYQDYAWLITNATPDTSVTPTPDGVQNLNLASFPGNAGGIDGSGFPSAQGTVTPGKIAYSNGQIQMTTSNDTNTSHTNALQTGVNAGDAFRIQSRFIGPFDAINAGSEQQGIYFGPNGSNYIKAEIDENTVGGTGRHLTIYKMVNGSGAIPTGDSILLPGGNASTIDLRIDVDPGPQDSAHYSGQPLVKIYYALNGSTTFTQLNTGDLNIPTSWITANTPAGIVTSNQEGGSPFVATFASFSVTRLGFS